MGGAPTAGSSGRRRRSRPTRPESWASDSRRLLLCLSVLLLPAAAGSGRQPCGGHLTARRGVIATPGFPGPFAVPIHCRWILDASELNDAIGNSSIVVYLSQVYASRGLRFTEYAYYESEATSFGGASLLEIDEGNVLEHRWLRTYRPYLILEFELDRLEGNHVRVLDRLLDVYGFNLTYEMLGHRENPASCSLRDCSFAGNCLLTADYATFYCDCFEGFGGEHCGHGPLCVTERGNPICQNGGTCRHVGAAAVRCLCPPHFSGDFCEISTAVVNASDCQGEGCVYQCPFPGEEARPCYCRLPVLGRGDRTRFECRIKLTNVTYPRDVDFIGQNVSLESHLSKQLTKYMREAKISSMEDLKILSITPALEVNFHFFGESRDSDIIRGALNRLVQHRRLGGFVLEPSHFTFQQKPALRLQTLRLNQVNEREVQLGDQFVLSCLAVGSSDLKFTWYKDDMLVNMSKASRQIWYRHLPSDDSDYHTSILTVDKATLLDVGGYTCRVVDWGIQQCRTIHIAVRDDPKVKVVPMSITVDKGSTTRLMCTTPNMRSIGIGFGWTKNKALLRLEPGHEVWEDLYPAGSLLTISNAQKSAVYTCNVANRASSVRVDVVNRSAIPLCLEESAWGLGWPDTAPGSRALVECPRGFRGRHASRQCAMRDADISEWSLPDFSGCIYELLAQPYDAFRSLTLGYESTNGSATIHAFWDALQYRRSSLYPGEGDRLIGALQEVERYLYNVDELTDLRNSAESAMRIIDKILSNEHSILNQQNLLLLSQLVLRNLGYWSLSSNESAKHLSLPEVVIDVVPLKVYHSTTIFYNLQVPQDNQNKYPDWYNERVTIRLYQNRLPIINKTVFGIVAVYRNLAQFFPDTYITELEDGSDMEYRIGSRLISVDVTERPSERADRFAIELEFAGLANQSRAWNTSCAVLGPGADWILDGCTVAEAEPPAAGLQCHCTNPGTFALFFTTRLEKPTAPRGAQTNFVVILGCGSCLLQCAVSMLVLTAFWWRNRTWLNFLKVQCSGALVGAMATFIYAVHDEISEDYLSIVAMCLEAFLLIGTSSPISQALIIYAELSNIHPRQQLRPTVVAVITGVPILAILTTELTRKTVGWKHESWWLIFDTGVYNIFVTCSITLLLTFILLYIAVIKKTKSLLYKFVKKDVIKLRINMLHRSAIVIFAIVTMEVSSILYINSSARIYHYTFALLSAVLGFVVLAMYVMSGEVLIVAPVPRKWKSQTESDEENASDTVKGRTKQTELELEASPSPPACAAASLGLCEPAAVYPEARGVAVGIDAREYVNEAAAGAYAAASRHRLPAPEIQIHHVDDIYPEGGCGPSPRLRKYEVLVPSEQPGFEAYGAATDNAQPYKELMGLTVLQPSELHAHQPPPPLQQHRPTTILCSAQVETCLGGRPGGQLPDVTLALMNGEAAPPSAELLLTPGSARPAASPEDLVGLRPHQHRRASPGAEAMPDIANTMKRRVGPDGEDTLLKRELLLGAEEADLAGLTTNGMLDRISHDLDYLLNRTKEDAQ